MLELADIVRAVSPEERAAWRLLPSQQAALNAILQCRTPALGGQLYQCDQCSHLEYSYHSCGNRHCPKCHGQQTRDWLEQQQARLLPCSYYLVTFTLPSELRSIALQNQKLVYGVLLSCAAATLQKLLRDPKWLGAQASLSGVLHTWTRALLYHPHAHFLVSAGGLTPQGQWVKPKSTRFLVPVHALSKIFRAKIRDALKKAALANGVPARLWSQHKKWVVHAQPAGRGHKVMEYLGRYVFRIAITNSRLETLENGEVTFRYRDNRTQQITPLRLPAGQFLLRFLQHVLPKGLAKVRHYGLAASASKKPLEQARLCLEAIHPPDQSTNDPSSDPPPHQQQERRCPHCKVGRLFFLSELSPENKEPP